MPMKTIKSTVSYRVPNWNYCNVDRFDYDVTPSKQVCQFCVKTKGGNKCVLYDKPLMSDGSQIQKLRECCKATAGYPSVIEPAEVPTMSPKEIMKSAIDIYKKNVNDLIAQGYPRQMAEVAAEKYMFSNK